MSNRRDENSVGYSWQKGGAKNSISVDRGENLGVPAENQTSYPAPGQMLLYPGGISETEILLGYGGVCFASKMGQLAGNHFITITSPLDDLPKLGKMVLWEGAQAIRIEEA